MNCTAARIVIAVAVAGAVGLVIVALRDEATPVASTAPRAEETATSPSRIERARATETATETELLPTDPNLREVVTEWKEPHKPSIYDNLYAGLRWLKDHQSEDGSWHDPATTGIALLSFVSAGETTQSGTYRENVKNGVKYLRDVQSENGCLAPRNSPGFLRDHAIAALALVEAYGTTGSRVLKEPAQRAVVFAVKSWTPSSGWGRPDGLLDVETTGWMSMLVKSAKLCEFDVDVAVLDDAVRAIDQVTDHATGRVTARGGALPDETATAIGMLVRVAAGHDADSDEMIRKGAEIVAAKPPASDPDHPADQASWYFGTRAMWQMLPDGTWSPWAKALCEVFIRTQRTGETDAERGSWDPAVASASAADRVWSTSFSLLSVAPITSNWYPRLRPKR